ncbi:MAG: hypothetical protein DDT42_00670 [candidate division WS2 bacterium]|uniref:ADP-ribosylglycohydrolase n=1 Tax=Psychracetigena formicireducens TaxID=2986056 RepID=A0A9E2BKM0_PSYF1|nr:hypothetical protein [Candidatus Psychracetigena formicireducens]MBT9144819.1 hypothetical protein [Candidatus Psychracetigena formicireducens]
MKAWEMEREIMENAKPVVLKEDEQTWSLIDKLEMDEDERVRLMWSSRVPGSGAPERLIIGAVQSMENLGFNADQLEILINKGLKAYEQNDMIELNRVTSKIYYEMRQLPKDENSSYWNYKQYSDWSDYENNAEFKTYPPFAILSKDFEEKIYAGWVAQICAGALGTAIEGYTTENLKEVFGDITYYVRQPNTFNDDITYELAFLKAFENKGYEVSSKDIGEEWVALVPFGWSAEGIALRNLKSGIYPPESGYLSNPFREWIGAQMRGAICGMVAPANPREAARLAWVDGIISHHNNGVMGEIFNAVMVSLSFVENDTRKILKYALNAIPKDSEYYSIVFYSLEKCKEYVSWEKSWQACESQLKKYNWIHAYPNAAAEVIALWFGNGDFDKTMNIISMEGQDVDCNAAQIGTIIGIIAGLKGIDKKWTEPIGDNLLTYIRGMKKLKISELSNWTVESIRKAKKLTI